MKTEAHKNFFQQSLESGNAVQYNACRNFELFALRFYVPLDTKQVIQRRNVHRSQSLGLILKKLNPTQQIQTFIRNAKILQYKN